MHVSLVHPILLRTKASWMGHLRREHTDGSEYSSSRKSRGQRLSLIHAEITNIYEGPFLEGPSSRDNGCRDQRGKGWALNSLKAGRAAEWLQSEVLQAVWCLRLLLVPEIQAVGATKNAF